MSVNNDLNEYYQEMCLTENKRHLINDEQIKFVKDNISYDFNLIEEFLKENDYWSHVGYVQVEKSNYKSSSYPTHDFYKEKVNRGVDYMRQDDFEEYHNLVYQTNGGYGAEDSYSGWLLFPLKNGYYWKISFAC